jgi:isopentenyl-diphosphate Delta-isomerase
MRKSISQELVVLCDENGTPMGVAEKLETHHGNTPRHLAFSCYVFNDQGKILVTKRAAVKKVWPGVWTNTVCGHPFPDETREAAIARRLEHELGMSAADLRVVLPDYRYTTPPFKGIIENEICPVYIARATSEVKPNPQEVETYKWMNWKDYADELKADDPGNVYSWWCKDHIKHLKDHPLILTYSQTI